MPFYSGGIDSCATDIFGTWANNATSTATTAAWTTWVGNVATSTTLTLSDWVEEREAQAQAHTWTEAELADLRRQGAEAQARMDRYRAELRAEQEAREAHARAEALFRSYLNPDQLREYLKEKRITVCAKSGRRYRIHCRSSMPGNVEELDGSCRRFCAHDRIHGTPPPDQWLAQMFILRHHEDEFLRVANVH